MLIHSGDSRWILYIDTFSTSGLERNILAIAARAGDNKIRSSADESHRVYPEARLLVDNDGSSRDIGYCLDSPWLGVDAFPEVERHHITMTWAGNPGGEVKFYLDGQQMSSLQYKVNYDDGRALFHIFFYRFKPCTWPDAADLPMHGDLGTGRFVSGGIQAEDLHLYGRTLSQGEISQIVTSDRE